MNLQLLIPLLVTTLVAIAGWYAAHRLAAARDQANKRREERVRYLIDAYRKLSKGLGNDRLYEVGDEIRSAVSDIQLFGTPSQVARVQAWAQEMGEKQESDLSGLLADLRNDLRTELDLPPVGGRIWWFQIRYNEWKEKIRA